MTAILFVEVTANRLEFRVCELAEGIYARGGRLQILAPDPDQASRLDDLLWTFRPDSFIPHGLMEPAGGDPSLPVVITTREEPVPGIDHLLMMEFASPEFIHSFVEAIHFVVVDNRERREASRRYWVQLREAGSTLRHQKL
jgi:DNA polymerase-3 subunit chi